jgi:type II secretory pathway predicted ATPase ExeA
MANNFEVFDWNSNPFNFRIVPELFVGHDKEVNDIVLSINNGNKYTMILGPTGSGKTTLMKRLSSKLNGSYKHIYYLSKPPKDPDDWLTVFERITKPGFLDLLFHRGNGVNLYSLSSIMNVKLGNESVMLFVDEIHEASLDSLEWLRALVDHVENMSVVMAGLPVFENILKSNLETLMRRINFQVHLSNLTKSETREMIKRRIESYGGEDIRPFTYNTIDFIFNQTGGFPREILRVCDELVQKAMNRNITTIDLDFLKESDVSSARMSLDILNTMPQRQKSILETLSKHGNMTPTEVIDNMDLSEYKDRDNAVRSVNNLLRRLMEEKFVERKRIGKTYKYSVSSAVKTLMVEA